MNRHARFVQWFFVVMVTCFACSPSIGAPSKDLEKESRAALRSLYRHEPGAKALGEKAKGIPVFPNVTKVGLIVGGQGGDGALFEKGKRTGDYSTGAASLGLQAGAQTYGYALFFMTDEELNYLKTSSGWSIGTGPNIVIVDSGAAKDVSTTTGKSGVYAFIFGQKGLMAGIGLVGQKITKIK